MIYPEAATWVYQVIDYRDDSIIDSFTGPTAYRNARAMANLERFWEVRIQ